MAIERIPMSKEGFDKLKAQLDHMKNVDAPRIANQIAEARAEGACVQAHVARSLRLDNRERWQ